MKPILSMTGVLAVTALTTLPFAANAQVAVQPSAHVFSGSSQPDMVLPTPHPIGPGLPDHAVVTGHPIAPGQPDFPVIKGHPIEPGQPDFPAPATHGLSSSGLKPASVKK